MTFETLWSLTLPACLSFPVLTTSHRADLTALWEPGNLNSPCSTPDHVESKCHP